MRRRRPPSFSARHGSSRLASLALYLLERFEAGIVNLDARRHVVAMNNFARRVLPVGALLPFDRRVPSFHQDRPQPKVEFLLDQAAKCPAARSPPPPPPMTMTMTMIINIPERVLLIKVTRLTNSKHQAAGDTLVVYDITELVASDDAAAMRPDARRRLLKIRPVSSQCIVLLGVADVLAIQSEGHSMHVRTTAGTQSCNLNLGDLERFMRVHRSHIVNLTAVSQIVRDDGRMALQLGPGLQVPVSRTSAAELLTRPGVHA